MALQIIVSRKFTKKVNSVYDYLCKEWSDKVADDFITKVEYFIEALAYRPGIGSKVNKQKNIRKIAITKHNKIYYKVGRKKVYIITLIDTRQNPKKNKYE